jgi:hypothetical protein
VIEPERAISVEKGEKTGARGLRGRRARPVRAAQEFPLRDKSLRDARCCECLSL